MNPGLNNLLQLFERQQNYYTKKQTGLEAEVSSSHAVSQFVLVPDERHEAHVGIGVDRLLEDQDAVGLPRKRLHDVRFLRRLLDLLLKVLNLRGVERENRFTEGLTSCLYSIP